ncbi:MAG TPA: COX15/CtaA family protein [Pseudomonadales bacterium]|nr:COX15/CtaA family protein [Pseudomonadales bacterium]
MKMTSENRKPSFYLAVFATTLALLVVLLGVFTRLKHAGLGCPDWPTCYGHLWVPNTPEEINAANQSFAATPVETDKTWPEQIHRIFVGGLSVFVLLLAGAAIRFRDHAAQPFKLPLLLLAVIVVQALFGMWTVTLKLWPQVVTGHLLGGFATLSLLGLLAQRLGNFSWQLDMEAWQSVRKLRVLSAVALLVVIAQIALGGWTSSNYAALACPDLPMCQNQWLPAMDIRQGFDVFQHIGPNYLGGRLDNQARVAIHLAHRIGAVVTTCTLLLVITGLLVSGVRQARGMAAVIGCLLCLQVCLGVSNVLFALPLPVAVAHNGVGALLLLAIVTLNHRVFTARLVSQTGAGFLSVSAI